MSYKVKKVIQTSFLLINVWTKFTLHENVKKCKIVKIEEKSFLLKIFNSLRLIKVQVVTLVFSLKVLKVVKELKCCLVDKRTSLLRKKCEKVLD